eukprot:183851-Amphidinium_carterae.2
MRRTRFYLQIPTSACVHGVYPLPCTRPRLLNQLVMETPIGIKALFTDAKEPIRMIRAHDKLTDVIEAEPSNSGSVSPRVKRLLHSQQQRKSSGILFVSCAAIAAATFP